MSGRKLRSGELENQVLEVLWAAGEPMTPGAVHEVVAADRALAYTTVMTILTRLWEKDELTRRKDGRAYAYEPVVGRDQRVAQRMRAVLGAAEDHTLALNAFADSLPDEQRAALRKALGSRGPQR
ncbi:BlaI/MecI/CopY family transcriptional regulator [Actinomarinicola tropica]|uniref:Transcriptional regulator n=1 Tax=Actinomarinicola tropica TaxID=2789776 RepID=A0A5Q2RLU2_9ACTN|nr:BlaI/MecI/CopY family transcriptional regulator [Actinomarinicola tropica]QGG94165.1 transcriptional regulator [Actinomarinicola tropica]